VWLVQRDRYPLAEPDGIEAYSLGLLSDPLDRSLAGRADLDAYVQRAISVREAGGLLIRTNIGTSDRRVNGCPPSWLRVYGRVGA
jgi:hypothetical protein